MDDREREDFENDCASAWLDEKRDRELEEQLEKLNERTTTETT